MVCGFTDNCSGFSDWHSDASGACQIQHLLIFARVLGK